MSNAATPTPAAPPATLSANRSGTPALLAALTTLLLWSGTTVANKIAVGHMDPLTAGVLRSLLAGCLALGIAGAMRLPFPRDRQQRLLLAMSGLASFAVWPALLSVGLGRTSAGEGALMLALTPVLTVLIAALVERRLPSWRWWLGAILALAGTAALVSGRGAGTGAATGNLIILTGVAVCAGGYVAGARLTPVIGTVATTFWGLAIALTALIPAFLLLAPRTDWPGVGLSGWLAIGWMTLLSSLLGYALWFYALGHGGIGRIGSLQLAMPVLSLTAAVLVLDEPVSAMLLASCVVIVAGTVIAQRAG